MGMTETTYREFNLSRRDANQRRDGDEAIEALIDQAGRADVFALAAANGWTSMNPPEKWVWRQLAQEVLRLKSAPTSPDASTQRRG